MPPKVRITKEDILTTSIEMVREKGAEVLNARAIAAHMGCSTQPIFSNYASMDELKQDVMQQAYNLYLHFLEKEAENNQYPKYKASGMGYIRFVSILLRNFSFCCDCCYEFSLVHFMFLRKNFL